MTIGYFLLLHPQVPPPAPFLGGLLWVSLLALDISSISGIFSLFTCFYLFLTEKNATLRIKFIHWVEDRGSGTFLYVCPGSPLPLDTWLTQKLLLLRKKEIFKTLDKNSQTGGTGLRWRVWGGFVSSQRVRPMRWWGPPLHFFWTARGAVTTLLPPGPHHCAGSWGSSCAFGL